MDYLLLALERPEGLVNHPTLPYYRCIALRACVVEGATDGFGRALVVDTLSAPG